MSRKRLSLGIGAYALDKVVVAVIQLLTVPVLANAWGLTLFGIWAIVLTVPSFLVLGDFGIVNSAWARMVRFIARDEWDEARASFHTAWLVTLGLVTLIAGLVAAVIWKLPDGIVPTTNGFSEADSRLTLILLLVYGLSSIVFRLITAAYRAAMRYTLSLLLSTGTYLVENMAVVVLAWIGFGPVVAAAGLLIMRLIAILVVFAMSFRLLPRLRPGFRGARWSEWTEMWRPALAASALGFGLAAYLQGSVMILGAIAGAAAVPAFVAVRTLSRLGVQVATLVSTPVAQEFGNAMGKGELYRSGRFFGLVLVVAGIMAAGMGIGLVLLGAPFIDLWTHGAIVADPQLLVFMAVSSVAAMFWNPLSNLILALNRQKSFSYTNLAVSAVGLAQIYVTADRMGASSAGLSFAFVDTATLLAVGLFIWRHWLGLPEFRAGIASSVREMRAPLAMLRSIRGAA